MVTGKDQKTATKQMNEGIKTIITGTEVTRTKAIQIINSEIRKCLAFEVTDLSILTIYKIVSRIQKLKHKM